MIKYRVFENGKRCADYSFKKGWCKDTFDTRREAEIYAFCWCYPVTKEQSEKDAFVMTLGEEYDMSMSEFPVMMKIEEVEE